MSDKDALRHTRGCSSAARRKLLSPIVGITCEKEHPARMAILEDVISDWLFRGRHFRGTLFQNGNFRGRHLEWLFRGRYFRGRHFTMAILGDVILEWLFSDRR